MLAAVCPAGSFPLPSSFWRLAPTVATAFSRIAGAMSISVTGNPNVAAVCAIPCPMVPAPMTAKRGGMGILAAGS